MRKLSVFDLPKKIVRHFRCKRFFQQYPNISRGCCLGSDGLGKSCSLEGGPNLYIGSNTYIGDGSELLVYQSHFATPLNAKLEIGKHVRMTARCRITCAGNISIGDDALIAPDVFITDHNHGMNPEAEGGYSPQDITVEDVCIGKGVWLGQRVCVLPGVTIGEHSIIGANSVVTHDIPPFSIAVGASARVVKKWDHENKCWYRV